MPKNIIKQEDPKDYQEHSIFIILDGQDLHHKDLKFSYVEIAGRVASMIPMNIWKLKSAERLNLYEKLNLAPPAYVLQK